MPTSYEAKFRVLIAFSLRGINTAGLLAPKPTAGHDEGGSTGKACNNT